MRRRAAILALASIAVVAILGSAQPSGAAGTCALRRNRHRPRLERQLAWQAVPGASGYTVYRGTSAAAINTALTGVGAIADHLQ
jgi:hypothetical protein